MANQYGFDFLKTEHLDESAAAVREDSFVGSMPPGSPMGDLSTEDLALAARNKPDLEKQFDVLHFLKEHRDRGPLAPDFIYKRTGIDLEVETNVASMLQNNPKVNVERLPDPENPALNIPHYSFQATYPNIKDRATLLAQINREFNGVAMRDLLDSYESVATDIQALITAGDIIAMDNTEDKDKILFPRGESFLVELDGSLSIMHREKKENPAETANNPTMQTETGTTDLTTQSSNNDTTEPPAPIRPPPEVVTVETDVDPRPQIRRGEAIFVGGQWFRVSSAVKAGVSLAEQPVRAQAPLTVAMRADLKFHKKNEADGYIRPFDSKTLPLDGPLNETAQDNITKARQARDLLVKLTHGRSGGVKDQLLGSHAHASNPTLLATSLAGNTAASSKRRRPTSNKSVTATAKTHHVSKEELEKAASDPYLSMYRHARRHGCTKDVREMYLETRSLVPESDQELKALLVKHKLMDPDEQLRPKRLAKASNVDDQGKPKKRRYYERKNQRWTNTHLEGTEIGAALARAQEKQKQGQSVGDGGM